MLCFLKRNALFRSYLTSSSVKRNILSEIFFFILNNVGNNFQSLANLWSRVKESYADQREVFLNLIFWLEKSIKARQKWVEFSI